MQKLLYGIVRNAVEIFVSGSDESNVVVRSATGIHFDVIRRVTAPHSVVARLEKYVDGHTDLFVEIVGYKFFFHARHTLLSVGNDVWRERRHTPCHRSAPRRIRENVYIRKPDFSCKSHTVFKLLLRLGRETDDNIGRYCRLGIILPYQLHAVKILRAIIFPVHLLEDGIVTALQRQMEMRTKSFDFLRCVQKFACDYADFERTEPNRKIEFRQRKHKFRKRRADVHATTSLATFFTVSSSLTTLSTERERERPLTYGTRQ